MRNQFRERPAKKALSIRGGSGLIFSGSGLIFLGSGILGLEKVTKSVGLESGSSLQQR
jgi:hypothetical protein